MTENHLSSGQKPRVCIVGAGVAGLRAANMLLAYGAQVTMLEARNRVGGRIAQSNQLGHAVDLGPNWLQGTQGDPIIKLAHETNTIIHSWPESQVVLDDTGEKMQDSMVVELQETFWEIVNDAFRLSYHENESIDALDSLLDFVRKESHEKFKECSPDEASRKQRLLLQTADMWGAFVGNAIERQSLKFCWLEKTVEEEELFAAGTFSAIMARLAEPIVGSINLRLQQRVEKVSNCEDGTLQVKIEGQVPEVFDEVIVTVPLGCLKAKEPAFSPPLPFRLQQAIGCIGYGCLEKVYITFPFAFWQQYNVDLDTGAKGNDLLPGITYWLAPTYASSTNPEQWTQVCVDLATLPSTAAHPTLLFYTFGHCAQHIAHLVFKTSPDKLEDTLFDFFCPYVSRLPGYDADNPNCTPRGILATAWTNDEFAGHGSYSNFQIGLEQGDKDIECMREGLPDRRIWFAGEHTAPFSSLGTVTGAYLAGEKVANRIIEHLKSTKDDAL